MKYFFLLSVSLLFTFQQASAQNADDFFAKVNEIEKYAKMGIDDGEYKPLLKAISLLLDHPDIRPMNFERKDLREDYFNPYSLIKIARKPARTRPMLRWRLNRLERRLRKMEPENIAEMAPSPEDVRIPGTEILFFKSKEIEKRMRFDADESKHVIMEFQLGIGIGIHAFNARRPNEAIATGKGGQVKRIEFDVKAGQSYFLELFNNSGKTARLRLASFMEAN